jgi:hypothetical protein
MNDQPPASSDFLTAIERRRQRAGFKPKKIESEELPGVVYAEIRKSLPSRRVRPPDRIALSLSGGGHRATLFGLAFCLRWSIAA